MTSITTVDTKDMFVLQEVTVNLSDKNDVVFKVSQHGYDMFLNVEDMSAIVSDNDLKIKDKVIVINGLGTLVNDTALVVNKGLFIVDGEVYIVVGEVTFFDPDVEASSCMSVKH